MPAAAAAAAPAHQLLIEHIATASIQPSPSNPRKTFKGIEELAEDLRQRGILQPLRVRPKGQGYELVFGERRWRAAKLAKLEAVPAIVEPLGDQEALELMLVELAQTENVHPVEEAEAYRELHEKHKLSIEEIAAKVGKSKATVYARMKLCSLPEAARKAALAGELPASHALLIARIPDAKLQAAATKEILTGGRDKEALSYREAVDLVQRDYMLRLDEAPFDRADATLVAAAGACTVCPKRTGNQKELFADVKSADVCTDPKCYQGKVEALWQIKKKEAEKAGQKVIEGKAADKLFYANGSMTYGAELQPLDGEVWVGDRQKKIAQLVGKDVKPVLARDPTGAIRELVPKSVVEKATREASPKAARPERSGPSPEVEMRRKLELRRRVVALAMGKIIAAVKGKSPAKLWRHVLEDVLEGGGYHDAAESAAKRRGLEVKRGASGTVDYEAALAKAAEKYDDSQVVGLVFELLCSSNATGGSWSSTYGASFLRATKFAGVDLKKLEAVAKEAAKAKAAPKAKSEKAAAPKAKKAS